MLEAVPLEQHEQINLSFELFGASSVQGRSCTIRSRLATGGTACLAENATHPLPGIGEVEMATAKKAPAKKAAAKKVPTTKAVAKAPAAKPKLATKKATAKKAGGKSSANSAFMKPLTPSAALAAIVGDKPIPRTEVTKRIWEYIKSQGLQDQAKKTMINADAKLREIFKKAQVSMFEMTKLIGSHLK